MLFFVGFFSATEYTLKNEFHVWIDASDKTATGSPN